MLVTAGRGGPGVRAASHPPPRAGPWRAQRL